MRMLLNADLGEHEPIARTRALMPLIDMANIACGGHAGTVKSMETMVGLAREFGVKIGAHPGLSADFGRGTARIDARELETLVLQQAGALKAVARRLHHIKLHGALYHAVEGSDVLASAYVSAVARWFPGVRIVSFAGGKVGSEAAKKGVKVLHEVFAERGYRPNGTLIPRGEPGALIESSREVVARLSSLRGDTVCVHSDSPNAVRIARAVRKALDAD